MDEFFLEGWGRGEGAGGGAAARWIKGGTFLERGSGFSGKVIINSKYKFYFTTLI